MTKPANIQYLDALRAFAVLGVIVIHNTTPILKMMYGKNIEFWWIGNVVYSSVRYVIALFLMLSGATMLGKEYRLAEFYKKRFIRVLLPYLFWALAYLVYRWWELAPAMQPRSWDSAIRFAIALFQTEGISKHFWYIYMIMVIYPFVPFIGKWVRNMNKNTLVSVLLGWVLLNVLVNMKIINPVFEHVIFSKLVTYFLHAGYLILGYYVYNLKTDKAIYTKIALPVFLITIAYAAIATYFLSKQAHKLDTSAYGNLTINTMLQSFALFIICKNAINYNRYIGWVIKTISDYSYGIYLVHIMVISLLFNNGIFWTIAHPLVTLPMLVMLTLLFSVGIIAVLRKMPGGKYISG